MFQLIMQSNAGAAPAGGGASFFITLILMFGIFWFFLIRPQNKRMKQHREMLAAIKRGDTVVSNGGLVGKVTKITDDEVTLDLGEQVKVKVVRSMIADVRNKTEPANDTGKAKK